MLADFAVSMPILVERTAIATIWKVQRADGTAAALKIYPDTGMGAEAAGFDLLQALDGAAAARVFARSRTAALIEWLDGPSLGDLTRAGQDDLANATLIDVAQHLHAAPLPATLPLPDLHGWFNALFDLTFHPTCPTQAITNINRCKTMAKALLAAPRDVRPLHGDLHHDNIRLGARGYTAFDAKGVLGERAYELANAFRNPSGAAEIVANPARFRTMTATWATAFDIDPHRLATWACVKSALSIAWRAGRVLRADDELPLLAMFLQVRDTIPTPPAALP